MFGSKQVKALKYFRCHLLFPSSDLLVSVSLPEELYIFHTKTAHVFLGWETHNSISDLLSKSSTRDVSACVLGSFHHGANITYYT